MAAETIWQSGFVNCEMYYLVLLPQNINRDYGLLLLLPICSVSVPCLALGEALSKGSFHQGEREQSKNQIPDGQKTPGHWEMGTASF